MSFRLISSAVCALAAYAASAQEGAYDWGRAVEIIDGIQFAKISVSEPRTMDVHCMRIDAANPWLRFTTTSRAPQWTADAAETIRKTTRNFLIEQRREGVDMLVAINADGFRPWPAPFDQETPADLSGLAVASDVVVSPDTEEPSFAVYDDGTIDVVADVGDVEPVDVAVSGFGIVLKDGAALVGNDSIHPRTGIGVSADKRYAFFLVIDGRRRESEGATTEEVGRWLLHFGAHDGLNMDGGGSSTMVQYDRDAESARLLNNPVGNGAKYPDPYVPTERANGNNLGVYRAADKNGNNVPDDREAR